MFRFDKIKEQAIINKCKKEQEEEERKQSERLELIFEKCANLLVFRGEQTITNRMFYGPRKRDLNVEIGKLKAHRRGLDWTYHFDKPIDKQSVFESSKLRNVVFFATQLVVRFSFCC